ncbi:exodeoxyribonuclease III [uncultured Phycicoccus sp.]|uniref:exodeoxyribonuclease III n=1 Tax=uncultured Phycicoccus sp. TaxID=661422 RepID=UPI00261F0A0F|nr:exodeoxyribonuclease III [uncultured Phycicoccus sp.]
MLLASANVNGIRAAVRRGGLDRLAALAPDVVTLQEVRADDAQLRAALSGSVFETWDLAHSPCVTKGRSGVAVLSRHPVKDVRTAVGAEFEGAGRWVEADVVVGGEAVTVASAYVHTGEAGTPRQDEKYRFLEALGERVASWAAQGRPAVLTGDLNIAHTADDLKNWKGNRGKAGFLPDEQAHLDRWAAEHGLVDVHRRLHGPGPGPYTWWSWRGKAFDTDAGWRIDYQLATAPLAARAVRADVGRAPTYAERWSDHAPVLVDYAL